MSFVFKGEQGVTGPQGPAGVKGEVGPTGATGPKGEKGNVGPKGDTGASVKILGTLNSQDLLPSKGNDGDSYIIGQDLFIWNGSGWTNVGAIKGPQGATGPKGPQGIKGATGPQGIKGATGPQGIQGATGPQGPQGIQGVTGPQGIQGTNGVSPNITIGTVSILPPGSVPTAEITGVSPNLVLNLGIPASASTGEGSGSSVDLSKYAQLTGATFTGRITSPEVSATNYFVTPSLVGEGDNKTYYHRVDFGHKSFDHWDFYEYGGVYNFYRNMQAGKDKAELLFSITPNKITSSKPIYEGNVRVYSPNNKPTAADLGITNGGVGPTGSQGPQGIQGATGATGPQGKVGPTGATGPQGKVGPTGATFTPNVDSNGNLSWTNDKGLANPNTVNIKGSKGDKGDNGADYTKTLTNVSVVGSRVQLTTNEYQYCDNIANETEIVLPTTSSFTEIHLFIKPTSAISLVLPSAKYQNSPTIEANKVYEFIFTYVNSTIGWLGGVVVYG